MNEPANNTPLLFKATVARREERRVHNAVGGTQATQQRCHSRLEEECTPIFALATSSARSALHLHRISGVGIFDLLSPYILSPFNKKTLNLKALAEQNKNTPYARYVLIVDPQGNTIDDVMITLFCAPKSFTGEDVIEISVHGNHLISARLQSLLRSIGMRDAHPGEFSLRSVLNGKHDLAQVEGINQLIHADTLGAIELARNNMEGLLSRETEDIRTEMISLLAYLEAHIDFAPDEVGNYEPPSLLEKTKSIKHRLQLLLSSFSAGLKIKEGVKIVLCGKPNAGKSSLYNALLKSDKAIVTDIPGTTRDVLEERLVIGNKDFVLLDTAGLRTTSDVVEKIGVEKSLKSVKDSDVVCLVMDLTNCPQSHIAQHIQSEKTEIENLISDLPKIKLLTIVSKKDLLSPEHIQYLSQWEDLVLISQNDIELLTSALLQTHAQLTLQFNHKESPTLISTRQKDKVEIALACVEECEQLIAASDYPEKIAATINHARHALEEIVGEIGLDNVLEKIFSSFCIGK